MSECCPDDFITPGEAASIAFNYVYNMYRSMNKNILPMSLTINIVKVYRRNCFYNVAVDITLIPIFEALKGRRSLMKTGIHHLLIHLCTGKVIATF